VDKDAPGSSVEPGSLSPAERRVYEVAIRGLPVKEIAAELVVSEATVATHLSRIYGKFGVHSRAELIARASGPAPLGERPSEAAPPAAGPPGRAIDRSWVAVTVAVASGAAGLLVPLSSLVLGPVLVAIAIWWGDRTFGRGRPLVFVIGALLIMEAVFVVSTYRAT
jgi:DNA-binding CsgD family transcriptional regulator